MSIIGAETIGTALLILLGDGVVAAVVLSKSKAENSGWIVITFGWGMAVAMAVWAVVRFSGANINPAVTVGLWVNGTYKASVVWKYFIGEMLGAIIGAALVVAAYWDHFKETEDQGAKLAVFSTGPAIRNYPLNFITEFIGTFVLIFGIFTINDAHNAIPSYLWPLVVGLLVFAIGLSLGGPTGYAINPARDLGPRIVHWLLPVPGKGGSDWSYAWVPVLAPICGAIVAALAFKLFIPKELFTTVVPAHGLVR